MTISYNWLSEYLPEKKEPERLSKILTSIGLEVESMEAYESIKGGLKGLIVGEVLECEQHLNADKLKITKVNIGSGETLQIVCGANNVAAGQKVIVATAGTTIHPISGEAMTMKVAKIRGVESHGMICAEDEIGIGNNHAGIIVLPNNIKTGTPAAEYFKPYNDFIFEIGLTPNRMDAMSHYGVARDVCAYLTHHGNKEVRPKTIFANNFKPDNQGLTINVVIENKEACPRYAGITISNIEVKDSPQWLKDKLVAIGQRPINNIVDITNFILHETGQPLHAFDADEIKGNTIIVKNVAEGTSFISLDEKERKLSSKDLMICNAEEAMCIAGVFGGIKSGVKETTKNIFLESAFFNPVNIRKTALRLGLRTEAATRFEKGVDISNTVNVLKRAALMIKEIAGGEISSDVIDVYPNPKAKTEVALKHHYLKKLSGKNYHADAVKKILTALNFEIVKDGLDELRVAVPFSKPDITLPADIVEEIVRIDGLDNIEIPSSITISPSVETLAAKESLKEKISERLAGIGFNEIMTNSITNSKYFNQDELKGAVKMLNNLSADLDILRPSMLETGLEAIAFNINRKNSNLLFFEFGKTYQTKASGKYHEEEHLSMYISGANHEGTWNDKSKVHDIFSAKGMAVSLLNACGINNIHFTEEKNATSNISLEIQCSNTVIGKLQEISTKQLQQFDIKQPVYFIDLHFEELLKLVSGQKIVYKEIPKFPAVQRDLAVIVSKDILYKKIESSIESLRLSKLQAMRLFDVFESEKIGLDKKSLAVNFTFLDEEKTLTDKEIDTAMGKIISQLEKDLNAEIRK